MYCRLSYTSEGVLPLKIFVLYIYRLRGTMQYNQQSYVNPIFGGTSLSNTLQQEQ
jgi:hypothetical protein